MTKILPARVLAASFCLVPMMATAADISISGFGTAAYARSDQAYNYERFVNDRGTFKRDSVLGVQLDAKLNNEFGLTLQGKVAPSLKSDKDIDTTVSWAFLSWRPTNDWLVRVGRVRQALYLYSANMDVGATYDFARLPVEVYTTSQTTDGDGISIDKAWNINDLELTLQGYWAAANTSYRFFRRDKVEPLFSSGSYFVPVRLSAKALTLTLQHEENIFRTGFIDTYTKITDDQVMPVTFPYVSIMPGIGYFQTSNLLPGPGVMGENNIHAVVYTLGADVMVGGGFRVIGEYVRRDVRNIETGPDTQAAYLALLKPIGAWTPYVSLATLQSMPRTRTLYNNLNGNTASSSALLNASQRAGADGIMAYDQTTWALGASYRVTHNSKLKAEWARTRTGDMSSLIDAPPGGTSGGKTLNVFSFSYNVVF
jgi:hypothetical protein